MAPDPTSPGPLAAPAFDSVTLAARLGGAHQGPRRTVTRLLPWPPDEAPHDRDALADALVVAFDAAAASAAAAAGVGVVVGLHSSPGAEPQAQGARIAVDDPRRALAALSAWFDRRPEVAADGIHPSAVVHPGAALAPDVAIGPLTVVAAGVRIGAGTRIGAHCSLGAGAVLGAGCRLHDGVRLYDGVRLGDRVRLHSGCVLGADGFGYAAGPTGAEKIHHLGGVEVGDDVELGANTCVDRGTLSPTRIGARSKIDNHCQIGHNVRIGSDCLIAGMSAIGGSTSLGDGVVLGGAVVVADHVHIGDGARVAGASGVSKRIPAGETWAGTPAQPYRSWVRGLYLQGRLERIWAFVKARSGATPGPQRGDGEGASDDER